MGIVKSLIDRLDRVLVLIAALTLIGMMGLVTVSVIGRYFFNSPVPDDVVMTELAMTFLVFLPLSAVQASREHVFVTFFTEWTSNKAKVVMETIGVLVGLGIFAIFAAATFGDLQQAYEYGTYVDSMLEIQEWPARLAVFLGIAVFVLRLALDAVMALTGHRDASDPSRGPDGIDGA